jgi:hypothetical protein
MMKGGSNWRAALIKASAFWFAAIVLDLILAYFFGPQLWSYAGYFFGSDARTTLIALLFIEGGVLFAFGVVWASGAMETTFGGSNIKLNPYYQREPWKQRREQTEKQNTTGEVLMFAGGPLLVLSLVLVVL